PHRRSRLLWMGASAQCRGNCLQARIGSGPHARFEHNVKTTCAAVIEGWAQGVGPPSSRLGRPKHLRREACMDSPVMRSTPTVADAVIETQVFPPHGRSRSWTDVVRVGLYRDSTSQSRYRLAQARLAPL